MATKTIYNKEADNRRRVKAERKNAVRVNFDSSDSSFLPRMTREALKENAPTTMLLELCRYVVAKE